MRFALLMPAAGSGVRLGAQRPKALVEMVGVPMFVRAARPFLQRADCAEAVIATPVGWESEFRRAVASDWGDDRVRVITGGAERQDSVALALSAVTSDADVVLVHDAARPLVSDELIEHVLGELAAGADAVVPVVRVPDTLKRLGAHGEVVETLDRAFIVAAQTPQGLRRAIAEAVFERARREGVTVTDDVSLVERFGLGVIRTVAGDSRNLKITTAEDLILACNLAAHPVSAVRE